MCVRATRPWPQACRYRNRRTPVTSVFVLGLPGNPLAALYGSLLPAASSGRPALHAPARSRRGRSCRGCSTLRKAVTTRLVPVRVTEGRCLSATEVGFAHAIFPGSRHALCGARRFHGNRRGASCGFTRAHYSGLLSLGHFMRGGRLVSPWCYRRSHPAEGIVDRDMSIV